MKKHLKNVATLFLVILILLSQTACAITGKMVTMYAADGRTIRVCENEIIDYQNVNWSLEPPITIYDKDGNSKQIIKEHIKYYVNDKWEWWTEQVTLMYAADGRTTYIMNSEVEAYSKVGWSVSPPISLYKKGTGEKISALVSEVDEYISSGMYFKTYEEACPPIFTYDPFKKSNLSADKLDQMLYNTGLQGQGQAFYNMEQQYNVNALFAVAVACHESADGYKKANTNNFFGMKGNNGWMSFNSPYDNIMFFGKLMNTNMYYGKTINGIAKIYCMPPGHWVECVKKHMVEKWNKI